MQFLAESLPSGVFVIARHGIWKDREGDGAESREASECLSFLRRGSPFLGFDLLQGADRCEDVAGFRFLAAGKYDRLFGCRRICLGRLPSFCRWSWSRLGFVGGVLGLRLLIE